MVIRIYTFQNEFRFLGVARDIESLRRKLITASLLSAAFEVHGKDSRGNAVHDKYLSVDSQKAIDAIS